MAKRGVTLISSSIRIMRDVADSEDAEPMHTQSYRLRRSGLIERRPLSVSADTHLHVRLDSA